MTFYDQNELMAFPLVGNDSGLPHDILVDCIVHAPRQLGTQLQLKSISVTDLLVSCVLAIDGTPVAYLTLLQTAVETHVPIELVPIVTAVNGFVAFGEGVKRQRLRMDGPFPFLDTSLVQFEYDLTDATVKVGNHDWFGLIELQVGSGLTITAETLRVSDESLAIHTTLAAVVRVENQTYLSEPLAACAMPDEGPARAVPIRAINDVQPDSGGNIALTVVVLKELPSEPDIIATPSTGRILLTDGGQPCAS